MTRSLLLSWFFLFTCITLFAQHYRSQGIFSAPFIGQPGLEFCDQMNDYSIISTGQNYTTNKGFMIRFDKAGHQTWGKEFYINNVNDRTNILSVVRTTSGNFIFTALYTGNPGRSGYGMTDSLGNLLWFKETASSLWTDRLLITQMGSTLIMAGSYYQLNTDNSKLCLYRLDMNGNIIQSAAYFTDLLTIQKLSVDNAQGNIILCGTRHAGSGGFFSLKTDAQFNLAYYKQYSSGDITMNDATLNDIGEVVMTGTRFVGGGSTWHPIILKIDAAGNLVWARALSSPDWVVAELFGVAFHPLEKKYYAVFEPENFQGAFQQTALLGFDESGVADSIFFSNLYSSSFFTKLEVGLDSSLIWGKGTGSGNIMIWKDSPFFDNDDYCFEGNSVLYPFFVPPIVTSSTIQTSTPVTYSNAPINVSDIMLNDSYECFDIQFFPGIDTTGYIVPNVFSPNGDGVNDLFYIQDKDEFHVPFSVYNRWGEIIFTSTETLTGWDGTNNNQTVSEGTYYYITHSEKINFRGFLTLFR